ncbi:MAG: alanine racemase [Candidatus Eisenbacteria bacterium]|nr:alanine racemase [Candidatus Latescibacterota bacterium]MBD3301477.1 alanine racemase [Candidatus Eisenbacteria bacterium]
MTLELSEPVHASSAIELSESAYRRNVRFLRSTIGRAPTFSSVIKGNAYGHGIEAFVPMAERCGVRHFTVFSAVEASRALSAIRKGSEIMIAGFIADEDLPWALSHDLSFYVFDCERLRAAAEAARRVGRPARVHLELETGLNRTGLAGPTLEETIEILSRESETINVQGVCTHFAGAESIGNYVRVRQQIERFDEMCRSLERVGIPVRLRHTACSAAALTYPETVMDLVRFGIVQYGFWPTQETRMRFLLDHGLDRRQGAPEPLRRVMRWRSLIMSIKQISPGEFVGYGTSYQATRRQRVAAVPVGYYHGFSRSLSNLGYVLVRGRRAPVIGLVNMNMMMIDVTEVPGVEHGDEVVLIGKQKRRTISVSSFGDLTRMLNYEILVRIPPEIPRIVVA